MKLLDLFSGIGGFHLGLEQSGFKFDWVGFSEIDKYASKQYKKRFPNAKELGSVTDIQCEQLPKNIDILCGGFPCQSFSIAGLRGGFEDTRGTLFFEIVRILKHYKDSGNPIDYFILENVKGLLSHDDGKTFATIYGVLADLDYSVECQLLNTRWFLPQNRERIYIVGHSGKEPRRKVFPIGEGYSKTNKAQRIGDNTQYSKTITTAHAHGTATHMSYIDEGLKQIGTIGEDSEATRVYDPSGCAKTIKNGGGMGAKTGLYQVKPVLTPERAEKRQNGRRFKDDGEDMFTLTSQDQHGVMIEEKKIKKISNAYNQEGSRWGVYDTDGISPTMTKAMRDGGGHVPMITRDSRDNSKPGTSGSLRASRTLELGVPGTSIRRLTCLECERLQGFPDGWTEGQSDTQRYKQLGNAVSVPVVKAVGDKLIELL